MEDSVGLQLKGASVELSYSNKELGEIIRRNIRLESHDRLVSPQAADEFERFFGIEGLRLVHAITGDEESVEEFWLRHTLGRPREIATIGEALSNLAPVDRTPRAIRMTIRDTAAKTVVAYLGEMAPHVEALDPALILPLLSRNMLTMDEISAISDTYAAAYNKKYPDTVSSNGVDHSRHVFCNLFKLGLLGYVAYEPDLGKEIQIFRKPGEEALERACILPGAKIFVLHPVLDDEIARHNPDYFRNLHKRDIVGAGRLWRPQRMTSFVLKGDVRKFSQVMRDPVASKTFPIKFAEVVEEQATAISYKKISDGDSLILVDENPRALLECAKNIQSRLRDAFPGMLMRFAGDAGFVEIGIEKGVEMLRGLAVRRAARLEPHVRAGHIFVTQDFMEEVIVRIGEGKIQAFQLKAEDLPNLQASDGRFDIAKKETSEDSIYTKIYDVSRQTLGDLPAT